MPTLLVPWATPTCGDRGSALPRSPGVSGRTLEFWKPRPKPPSAGRAESTYAEVAVPNSRTLRRGNERSVSVAEHLIAALAQCRIARSWGKDPGLRCGATLRLDPVDSGHATASVGVERDFNGLRSAQFFR